MVGQSTPYGSLSYDQTGSSTMTDPSGKEITVPQFTATQTFSPSQQAIFDKTQAAQGNLAGLAQDQSARLSDMLGKPFEYNPANDATKWAYDLGSATILPQQKQDTEALQRQLVQTGLRPGTGQYETEMTRSNRGQKPHPNQLALQGNSQAFQQAAYERSNPINETSALLSGSQVTQPGQTFASTPQTQVGGVDYSGLVNNNYNQQVSAQNAQMGALGGLFGTIGLGAMKFSDRRLKSDIERIGTTAHGLPFYEYTIFGRRERGVMADEVAKIMPDAVVMQPNGFNAVNYSMLGLA